MGATESVTPWVVGLSEILWPEKMSEEKETLLEKRKAIGTIFELNFILSQICISEWTLSLSNSVCLEFAQPNCVKP